MQNPLNPTFYETSLENKPLAPKKSNGKSILIFSGAPLVSRTLE